MVSPQYQTSLPFGFAWTCPLEIFHLFPCFFICLYSQFSTHHSRSSSKEKKKKRTWIVTSLFQNFQGTPAQRKSWGYDNGPQSPTTEPYSDVGATSNYPSHSLPWTVEAPLALFSSPGIPRPPPLSLLLLQCMSTLLYPFSSLHKCHWLRDLPWLSL